MHNFCRFCALSCLLAGEARHRIIAMCKKHPVYSCFRKRMIYFAPSNNSGSFIIFFLIKIVFFAQETCSISPCLERYLFDDEFMQFIKETLIIDNFARKLPQIAVPMTTATLLICPGYFATCACLPLGRPCSSSPAASHSVFL